MRYITPKNPTRITWHLSDQTLAIVEHYAKYTGYTPPEVVDQFLKNMLGDPGFQQYLKTQRRTKRIIQRIFHGDNSMSLLLEYRDNYWQKLHEIAKSEMSLLELEDSSDTDNEHPKSPDAI